MQTPTPDQPAPAEPAPDEPCPDEPGPDDVDPLAPGRTIVDPDLDEAIEPNEPA
jgi:hypothetical protein